MRIKDRVRIKIDSIALGGEGVGRIDDMVAFVPFSATGDELEVEITQVKKNFVRGKIVKIIRRSPQRVQPPCRYYEKCGGCCYLHIRYEDQLAVKKKQVQDAFRRIGKISDPPVREVIASPEFYHYRCKAQFHEKVLSGRKMIGFLDVSGGSIIDIERCEIMDETINEKVETLRIDGKTHKEEELIVWSGDSEGEIVDGPVVSRVLKGKNFLVPRDGFFQTNLYLTEALVDEVCRLVSPAQPVDTIVDAYCGCGLFSIFLSPHAENIVGIEIHEQSIQFAKINAQNAGVENAKFIHGDVDAVLSQKYFSPGKGNTIFVLDPPRAGCGHSTLTSVADLKPQKIIYVSCNPATQARDVRLLVERGYQLVSLLPADMFPQTEHIEVAGFLELK